MRQHRKFMNVMIRRKVLVRTIVFVLIPVWVCAASLGKGDHAPLTGFNYLMNVAENHATSVDPQKFSDIIDYVGSKGNGEEPRCRGGLDKSPMAYHAIDVDTDMDHLIQYGFNPDIPSCAMIPSLVRVSCWKPLDASSALPRLWTRLKKLSDPVISHGVYYIQNTPDPNTGAYYGYTSGRTLILMKYKGRNVLVSVLKQMGDSDVGKKGYALSDGPDPEYFYSGEQGLNKIGLGWVKSYIYDSYSVSVYIENAPGEKGIRFGVFKWLRAGWAGKNIVKEKHVYEGLVRFADVFKSVIESSHLPSPDALARICKTYDGASSDDLKKKMEDYFQGVKNRCACLNDCPKMLNKGFDPDRYVDTMSPMEMKATLISDNIRHILAQGGQPGNVAYRPPGADDANVF